MSSGIHKFCTKYGLPKVDKFDVNIEPATVSISARQVVAATSASRRGGPDLATQLKGQLKEAKREIDALRKNAASPSPPTAAVVIDSEEMDTAEPEKSFDYSIEGAPVLHIHCVEGGQA